MCHELQRMGVSLPFVLMGGLSADNSPSTGTAVRSERRLPGAHLRELRRDGRGQPEEESVQMQLVRLDDGRRAGPHAVRLQASVPGAHEHGHPA